MNTSLKYYLTIGVLAFSISSCDKDRIDAQPLTVTENDFFTNNVEFDLTVFSAYATLTDYYFFRGNNFLHEIYHMRGDDITEDRGNRAAFELFAGLTSSNNKVTYYYERTYRMIQRCNVIIEKSETIDTSGFEDPARVQVNRGEALFLRGLAYFNLYNLYGKAPLVTERISERDKVNTPPSEGTQLLDQAIFDFEEAASLLPESWSSENNGRATRNAANGFLLKSLVFRGDYTGNTSDYTRAVQLFPSISRNLTDAYTDNFSAFEINNEESLFEFQSGRPPGGLSNAYLQNDGAWRGVESMAAYWGFFDTGNNVSNNNIGGQTWKVTEKLYNKYGDDPRISFFVDGDRYFTKYGKAPFDEPATSYMPTSLNNPRILRYADLILLTAEAIVKSGGSNAEAIALVNKVRTRARNWAESIEFSTGLPADYSTSESDSQKVLNWIMDERFVELCGEENMRFNDLRRWDARGDISLQNWGGGIEHFSTDLSATMQFEYPKHMLLPIPQTEMDRNSSFTNNNPGY
ncbi:RagB/SusD family nutrient uptake outer membrane protein [uncultured Algoriphagus sp.]|uniref:RagB/SusD family nutrient uptake outer membrane protein n=1 Tax=uncultured Algoriphagus sp. TaxID=417365 RepID=UPI0030EB3734|tara:strand:+ start:4407 stop:5963 length:1557 start_codon:yes stop_codon:yes gene_type:complete